MPELMAARVGDTIAHSPLLGLALTGIALGIAVGIALVVLTVMTGGADLVAGGVVLAEGATVLATVAETLAAVGEVLGLVSTLCTATSLFYTFGKWLGSKFSAAIPTGNITSGAATVFIGPGLPAAARYQDSIKCQEPITTYIGAMTLGSVLCPGIGPFIAAGIVYYNSDHAGATIAQGSKTVLTERKSQSRVGDKTSCGGTISTGCESVIVGGPPNAEVSALAELPKRVTDAMDDVDRVGVITGILSGGLGLFKASASVYEKVMELGLAGIDVGLWGLQKLLEHDGHEEAASNVEWARTWYETGLMVRVGLKGIGRGKGGEAAEDEIISIFGGHKE